MKRIIASPLLMGPLLMALLAACVPQEPAPGPVASCGAENFQGLVGQHERALRGIRLPEPSRVIRPGMAVTMDFRDDRLNVDINERRRISRIYCG
ncbi:MAG: I78 family peptidase inhibitor [Pseudorhodobacter sp.]